MTRTDNLYDWVMADGPDGSFFKSLSRFLLVSLAVTVILTMLVLSTAWIVLALFASLTEGMLFVAAAVGLYGLYRWVRWAVRE